LKSINLESDLSDNPKVSFVATFYVKEKFGNSYKDIPDEKFQEVVDYINFLTFQA
jgi:hypothetical protein